MSNTRVITEEVRFSYCNLLKPRESQFGGEPKYSVTVLIPKTDTLTKQNIDTAIQAAIENGRQNKWNGVVPPVVPTPIHDGDGVKQDGTEYGPECKGHWVLTASTGADNPPQIVDVNLQPILDATQVYSGMYGRIALNFAPYSHMGKKGIGCYISKNVQKTRDGEPLGATAPDAASDFGGAPAQQPIQNVATQMPTGFGQVPQQPVQQTYAQPQIDPITGAPISNGGYFGQ